MSKASEPNPSDSPLPSESTPEEPNPVIGVWMAMGSLPSESIVSEDGLAGIFGKHRDSIKRAVGRGELPKPFKLMGKLVWRVQALWEHFKKLETAAQEEPRNKVSDFQKLRP